MSASPISTTVFDWADSFRAGSAGFSSGFCSGGFAGFGFPSGKAVLNLPANRIANGYSVYAEVNGIHILSLTGGMSQVTQLFSENHLYKEKAANKEQAEHFILKNGTNSLLIRFEVTAPKAFMALKFYMYSKDYAKDVPVFEFKQMEKLNGLIKTNFVVYPQMPNGYVTQKLIAEPLPAK